MTNNKANTVPMSNLPKTNFNVTEASEYLGIGERTLRQLIWDREVRVVRFNRRIIIRKSDLDKFLEDNLI
jgi:excisionase family DNA binding protein